MVPESDNVFKWHVNIKCVQGIFKDVYIHLTLQFPSDYPSNPPSIKLITKLSNGLHNNITDNNICLPLFGADNYNKSASKYGSSWSPAFCIISLLINIASIFSEIEIEKLKNGEKLNANFTIKQDAMKLLCMWT